MSLTKRDHALALASKGFRVFPAESNGKRPIIKDWPDRATSDPDTVKEWWTDALGNPADHNIGVATGNTLLVVDLDAKGGKNGLEFVKRLTDDELAFTVTTPTGGMHVYLRAYADTANTTQKLAPGVDTRCHHGYVLGPGSEIDGNPYKALVPVSQMPKLTDLPEAPMWLTDFLGAPRPKSTDVLTNLSTEQAAYNAKQAVEWLLKHAPEAIENAAGDHVTFTVAAKLRDFGVPEADALDLLLEHWNEQKASPPWDPDELKQKIRNAYRYGSSTFGGMSAALEFELYEIGYTAADIAAKVEPAPDWPKLTIVRTLDKDHLPKPRQFLFREQLMPRSLLSGLAGGSGIGKTQFEIQMALSLVTGRNLVGLHPTGEYRGVLILGEDDYDEFQRRLYAAAKFYGIDPIAIAGKLAFISGVERRINLAAVDKHGQVHATPEAGRLFDAVKDFNGDFVIVDPLVEFHGANENDNVQMAAVAAILREHAVAGNYALLLAHHTRKPEGGSSDGHAGNQHSWRGASSLQGVTRSIITIDSMSQKDAKSVGVAEENRHKYVRLDVAKNNLGLVTGKPIWLERTSVCIGDDAVDPEPGEIVGVLKPVFGIGRTPEARQASKAEAFTIALSLCEGRGTQWTPWPAVKKILGDETVCPAGAAYDDRTWRRWIADAVGGSEPLPEGVEMRIMKGVSVARERDKYLGLQFRKEGMDFME